jgi:DNA-binding PadR family transcriptional regulator
MADRASLGQFEQLVLTAILDQGEDAYGVTIHRAVEDLMSTRRCQFGAVYATLDRLEDKGLVASWMSEPTSQRGGRAKRHYRLSADGEAALKEAAIVAGRLSSAIEKRWGGKPWKLA